MSGNNRPATCYLRHKEYRALRKLSQKTKIPVNELIRQGVKMRLRAAAEEERRERERED